MIIRYTKATKAAADQPVKSSEIVGKDKQLLVFNITVTNEIPKNSNQNIFQWQGSGNIEAIQSIWITTAANVAVTRYHGYTFTVANNMLNLAIDNGETTAAIAAGSKWILSLIIGQKSVGA